MWGWGGVEQIRAKYPAPAASNTFSSVRKVRREVTMVTTCLRTKVH